MEVEFLSNMRYSLYTSDRSWAEWQVKLGKFGVYIDRTSKVWENSQRSAALGIAPTHNPTTLPSPPVSTNASPPYLSSYSPSHHTRSSTPILLPQINSTAVSPIGLLPELDPRFSRKRSYDENGQEPPSKRHAPYSHTLPHLSTPKSLIPTSHAPTLPPVSRVPLPSLSIPSASQPPPLQMLPQLPPPGSRAMSMVYQPQPQWTPQVSNPTSIPPLQAVGLPPANSTHMEHPRQLSPYPGQSATASPVSATYTPIAQNQNRLSPSFWLAQRSSPYRPVRQVQALLAPPASSSMHNAPRLMPHDQMQYHPLGRPMNERRVGHLPYIHHDAWPETPQFHHYPELPPLAQPIFQ